MKKTLAALALVALVAPAVAQQNPEFNPQACFGNTSQTVVHWNTLVVPCFQQNHAPGCAAAAGYARGRGSCVARLQVQEARIYYNQRDAMRAYNTAEYVTREFPNEVDAWVIMGLSLLAGATPQPIGPMGALRNVVATLNRLSLTPEQARHRDAMAQRVAAADAKLADAHAAVEASFREVDAAAKKACGWSCSDLDQRYYKYCYRTGAKNNHPKARTEMFCPCSLKFYKAAMGPGQLTAFINQLVDDLPRQRQSTGDGMADFQRGLEGALGGMEAMGMVVQAQSACSRW